MSANLQLQYGCGGLRTHQGDISQSPRHRISFERCHLFCLSDLSPADHDYFWRRIGALLCICGGVSTDLFDDGLHQRCVAAYNQLFHGGRECAHGTHAFTLAAGIVPPSATRSVAMSLWFGWRALRGTHRGNSCIYPCNVDNVSALAGVDPYGARCSYLGDSRIK